MITFKLKKEILKTTIIKRKTLKVYLDQPTVKTRMFGYVGWLEAAASDFYY
jgi:hypothetical protein